MYCTVLVLSVIDFNPVWYSIHSIMTTQPAHFFFFFLEFPQEPKVFKNIFIDSVILHPLFQFNRPKKSSTTGSLVSISKASRDDDPCLNSVNVESLLPLLPDRGSGSHPSVSGTGSNGSNSSTAFKGSQGTQVSACTETLIVLNIDFRHVLVSTIEAHVHISCNSMGRFRETLYPPML